jgi:acetyltransferase
MSVSLSSFSSNGYDKGASSFKQILWYFVNAIIVRSPLNPFISIKILILRMFGAQIGKGVIIKNEVRIKAPWNLRIGHNCWIGEKVWIDNLDKVFIGDDVCISQGAMLLTGNHDYTLSDMPYRNAPILICDGAWVGAQSTVCPGVTINKYAILTVGSVATKDMEESGIYQGVPAVKIRTRVIR